jgi:PKD repeat protein
VLKSEGNELEVERDTQLIALDVLAYWMKLGTNERFSITSSNTITPFWEKWGDEVTGHFVDIGIEEFYDFNSCAIPLSSAIPSPTNPCKDARILINSVIYGNAPSDTNFNVVVKDQLGALVGSLIGGEWIVNTGGACADATYTIEDTLGNVLYTGTIPSGGSVTEVIGNSTLNVNKSDGTLISSRSILAEDTDSYNVGDSSAVLKDEDNNVLSTTPIKATETEDIVAPNGDVSVNSVAFDDVLSGGTLDIQVLKSTGNDQIGSKQGQYWRIGDSTITNSDSTYDVDVKATESLVLPDSQINVNGVDEGDVVSVKTIDVNLEDSLGTPVTPTSVGLVGNTLTIEVPSGGGSLAVDFSVDDVTPDTNQTITFTDLTIGATSWVWDFGDGTSSTLQNPTKVYAHSGVYNVTLAASDGTISGEEVKTSYITCTLQALPSTNIQMHNQALIGASPSNAILVSGAISQWDDAINSYHRTQGIAANRPTYLYPAITAPNGIVYGAARFDGSNDLLINSNAGFTRTTGSFEVLVVKLNGTNVGSRVLVESASSFFYEFYVESNRTFNMFNGSNIQNIQGAIQSIYAVLYVHWNGASSFIDWNNKSRRITPSNVGTNSSNGSAMGATSTNIAQSQIDVLEHIIYTAKPSDSDITLIQERIVAQYGNIF